MTCTVSQAEAGQKLLSWLVRLLDAPRPLLHRWIRTGQVRVNGGRVAPFRRLEAGDAVRLPPFAVPRRGALPEAGGENAGHGEFRLPKSAGLPDSGPEQPGLLLVAQTPDLYVFCKPAGLPTHPGTGHEDSLTSRLHALDSGASFRPTPAHRLDKDTSGLLVAARTYASLCRLQALLSGTGPERCSKEYLAWVGGIWPDEGPVLLQDRLCKLADRRGERVHVCAEGREAALTALCLLRIDGMSLLQIRLHTGRTHQIRVQLASRGFPVAGDRKYGAVAGGPLLLHAARLILPEAVYEALPPWTGIRRVRALPPPLASDVPLVSTCDAHASDKDSAYP